MTADYPWLRAQWESCLARLTEGRIPHALLLSGETGVGVGEFAERLVGALLCENENKDGGGPCGGCRACRLHESRSHPDFMAVEAEKEGAEIKVAQIRELLSFLQISRHYDGFKTILIRDAETMNRAAANSLLKMLEEPPADTVMVLASHSPFSLPATVRSRCQAVRLSRPLDRFEQEQAAAWLAEAGGLPADEARCRLEDCSWCPLHALAAAGSDTEEAESVLDRNDFRQDLDELAGRRADLIAVAEKWKGQPPARVHRWLLEEAEAAVRREFTPDARGLTLRRLFNFYDRQKYRCLSLKVRLNPQLLLESALIEWQLARTPVSGGGGRQGG